MRHQRKCSGEAEATGAGLVRTLRRHVKRHAGMEILAKHSIMAWMVEHAGTTLSFFSKRGGLVWRAGGVSQAHASQAGSALGVRGAPWCEEADQREDRGSLTRCSPSQGSMKFPARTRSFCRTRIQGEMTNDPQEADRHVRAEKRRFD